MILSSHRIFIVFWNRIFANDEFPVCFTVLLNPLFFDVARNNIVEQSPQCVQTQEIIEVLACLTWCGQRCPIA